MGKSVHISVRVPAELLSGVDNVSAVVRDALSLHQRRGMSLRTVELRLRRTAWADIDRIIELLSSRYVRVEDLQGPSGDLAEPIKRRIQEVVTPTQAKRIEFVLAGMYYEEVAVRQGVSKQAVQQSLKAGFAKLAKDRGFISALVRHFESEIDPSALMEAMQHERQGTNRRPSGRSSRS